MALLPGTRIRNNGITGNITDNPLSLSATLFNSVNLAKLGVVSGDHAIITLDPLRQFGEPEIIMVTAHTATSTTATIQRAMYGTTARGHPLNTLWVHAATTDDFSLLSTSSTRPTDVWKGQQIFESDTLRPAYYNGTTWLPGSGIIVCTSATRPPSPFTGQHIYETDTGTDKVWSGTAWDDVSLHTTGVWTAYTPTTSNITFGNGTITGRYTKIGRTVNAIAQFIFGSTSGITGRPGLGVPLPKVTAYDYIGTAYVLDSGAKEYIMGIRWLNDTIVEFLYDASPNGVFTNNGVPFTPGTSDLIRCSLTYESAT